MIPRHEIARGGTRLLQIIGPQASGKSTLISLLCRQRNPPVYITNAVMSCPQYNGELLKSDLWILQECCFKRAEGVLTSWLVNQSVTINQRNQPPFELDISNHLIIHDSTYALPMPPELTLVWRVEQMDNWGMKL